MPKSQLLLICPECLMSFVDFKDSFAYDYVEKIDRTEKIAHLIEIEKQKAAQVLISAELDKHAYLKQLQSKFDGKSVAFYFY